MVSLFLGQAKKGGNEVASMLWKELKLKGLQAGSLCKELNFVFDNCAGQNKNRMVLRFIVVLAKLKFAKIVRAIFLVKGHTKNDCDRMFNLMKFDYRKENIYTPTELIALVNKHKQVNAIAMEASDFLDWSALEDRMMADKVTQVKKNHIFYVTQDDTNVLHKQECDGEPSVPQTIVLPQFQDPAYDWQGEVNKLQVLAEPGLQDIKWNELYRKWGAFIPEDKKAGFKYYMQGPPRDVLEDVKKQAQQARKQRAKRSRSTASNAAVGSPAKKSAPETQKNVSAPLLYCYCYCGACWQYCML